MIKAFWAPGDELKIWKNRSQAAQPEGKAWTCYIKGAARSGTALMLAHMCMSRGINLQALRPSLWTSLCVVKCKLGSMVADLISVAMLNAQLSARGAIRKSHDVATWMAKLRTLKKANCDPSTILVKWNERCTAAQKLEGHKRMAVLHLLQMPDDFCDTLLRHVSRWGSDNGCFLEETFSSKKLLLGYAPRTNKLWQGYLTLKADGLHLMLKTLIHEHDGKLPGN